jgi:hypothetical protein
MKKSCKKNCCDSEKTLDCCSPQFLILDKLVQGWSDVSTTGGENIPLELEVSYNDYSSIDNNDISGGQTYNSSASVIFNNVYNRCGNKVAFPGSGEINFNYSTYEDNDSSGNDLNINVNWDVSNNVYGNLINLGTVNAEYELFGKYYAYFYYTTSTSSSFRDCDDQSCSNALTSITNNLYQGWRGMTWTQFISNQIPYSSNSVNDNSTPNFGFGDSNNGSYSPPTIIPSGSNVYSNKPINSYQINYDNVLWAYLFVQTHRYSGTEICSKLDQVFGWYVNLNSDSNQVILLQNLPEFGLTITDNLEFYNDKTCDELSFQDKKKYSELLKLFDVSSKVIYKANNNPKECGNIIEIEINCEKWLVAVNVAKSSVSWSNNNNEYVMVASKLTC